ncbi:hypothetical protein F5Y13DRAFT_146610 [Hypoxylon sp. FL1857]|nr:hypothetical protein F5Y13DRAFT_146610 [Hypoxylon sp. FL1857]
MPAQVLTRLPFIAMTTATKRDKAMSARKREVIDLTAPSREPSVEPVLASSSTAFVIEEDERKREHSRTLSPSREVTPELDCKEEATPELPGAPATPKGKERRRSPSPVVVSRGRVKIEAVEPSGGAAATTEASSSTIATELPPTPKNEERTDTLSPRKRRLSDTPESLVIVKEELGDYDDAPPSPIDSYPATLKSDDDDDEDVFEVSPKKPKGTPDIDLSAIPLYRSANPSPLPLAAPVYHPDFPERPALRCPKRNPNHLVIECKPSETSRNHGRIYFKCRDCPNYGSFICWADSRLTWAEGRNGISPHERGWPRCNCGQPAREDIAGDKATYPDTLWYKCATDACRFRKYNSDDPLSPEEVNMYAGRQVY